MPAVGGGGSGVALHQAFEGIFTATTVRQRAFKEGSLIGLQGSSGAPVGYLAPVDIPLNSPAPGTNNALWVSFGGSFAGVDRATFDAALARKANAASLANYLRTSTYQLEKARLESGITGNDNDISALQTAINNLPSEVGDVTRQQLMDAVEMLEQQIGNVSGPLFIYELWAKSKTTVLQASVPQGTPADLDWALEDDVPDALSVEGDYFVMPLFYRGHINCEVWQGDTLEDRVVLEVESSQQDSAIGDFNVGGLTFANWAWVLDQVVIDGVNVNRVYVVPNATTATMLAGLEFRVYAEVALSRSTVNVDLDALTTRVEMAEDEIQFLEDRTDNIPLTSDILWATTKVLSTSITGRGWIDVDWTLEDDLPDGVERSGFGAELNDFIDIPEALRGELHVDAVDGDDNVLARTVVDIGSTGNTVIRGIGGNRMRVVKDPHPTDNTKVSLGIDRTGALTGTNALPANTRLKLYAVSALPRAVTVPGLSDRVSELESQVGNIPVSSAVLWASSSINFSSWGRNARINFGFRLSDDVPTGVELASSGASVQFPESFRGDIHIDWLNSAGELRERIAVPIASGNTRFVAIDPDLEIRVQHDSANDTLFIGIWNTGPTFTFASGDEVRIYGVTALPLGDVVTRPQLNTALEPTDVDIFPKLTPVAKADFVKTFALEFGRIPPDIASANRLIVTLNGSPIYNGLPTGGFVDNMVLPLPVTSRQIDNILTNVQSTDETLIVNMNFRLNNDPANLASRIRRVVIDRN